MAEVDSRKRFSKHEFLEIVFKVKEQQIFSSKEFKRRKLIEVLYWDWFFVITSTTMTPI
jgi:hypothetical protein